MYYLLLLLSCVLLLFLLLVIHISPTIVIITIIDVAITIAITGDPEAPPDPQQGARGAGPPGGARDLPAGQVVFYRNGSISVSVDSHGSHNTTRRQISTDSYLDVNSNHNSSKNPAEPGIFLQARW